MAQFIYATGTLDALKDQVRRFVHEEVIPHGEAWGSVGTVLRNVFRKIVHLGFFGIRYAEKFGGSEMDTIAAAAFAE